jgi:hypothetical protein
MKLKLIAGNPLRHTFVGNVIKKFSPSGNLKKKERAKGMVPTKLVIFS